MGGNVWTNLQAPEHLLRFKHEKSLLGACRPTATSTVLCRHKKSERLAKLVV